MQQQIDELKALVKNNESEKKTNIERNPGLIRPPTQRAEGTLV